ncbi:MAG: Orotidine 5'-phosphate decarboxylase [Candidatus Gottesmanbacteria bacterium GW2011_GWB1_43_11]|uniref:Orotidine 5'-phosphate decarboxylase n=1 Tax=Candidatus Gottesmanbacteria bacterium GW2011_GWB1_43_11 TaxID=1618446 RepID=A0A0G1CKL6_9BACT|nr:MAG: Orotidine 5'-phosphate decarboxylase [Candidatus Gottesmanbacteria bacterium GW2011_GWA2_42_16]KKS55793.1 MAG: Orotidine 5'-phosphate decarboxylase [Candidatus Gottesmanbacteria bacterium GW2011_GWA1_42_26]KKS82001.1 MAG: orotidine 5'-phosphate decarboxylase, orotidine-5'-phosphate decarboxylase [Candidatus Gottesmanbacteria bacterium GW2011_GWC1_43_10]KKS86360.1 MAG: Orotidine 5'-phosphate decarboxylase [Candidatus Gottesmanbacteria bacterium GW2011_GWB1_43_11]
MNLMTFQQKLDALVTKNNSLVCVGLDSDWEKLPEIVKKEEYPQFAFNKAIVDATHDLVCAYKPNSAFYEYLGSEGIRQLKLSCDYIREKYPEIPIILDAKRADIGSTNKGYVSYAFDYLRVDAITLHPYLGAEAIQPFLDRKDKASIILCRTSNPGAKEFQDQIVGGEPLYKLVAKKVVNEWNKNGSCMLVVGATYPEELAEVRKLAGDMIFLVPGIGAQGGEVEKTVKAGLNSKNAGIIINSSRGIIFASKEADFAEKARFEAQKLQTEINKYRYVR